MISICIIGSISGFLVSFAVTGIIRIYALRRNLIDHPNERSSHTIPTPRGGGIGIVCACIGAICAAALLGELSLYHSLALGGGGLAVALIGFLDDHTDIPARYRFLVHLGAAIFFLFFAWYGVPLNNYSVVIMTGVSIFFLLAIAWLINLYNFMDGIDGIAAAEGLSVSLGGAIFACYGGHPGLVLLAIVTAGAATGFLAWNWPPAKIFMGDAGSAYLGFLFGGFWALTFIMDGQFNFWWPILLAAFIVDATTTLFWRIGRREAWHLPHRNHAYQIVSRRWGHRRVTLTLIGINTLWLFPLAYCACRLPQKGLLFAIVAYLPLTVMAFIIKGWPETEPVNSFAKNKG